MKLLYLPVERALSGCSVVVGGWYSCPHRKARTELHLRESGVPRLCSIGQWGCLVLGRCFILVFVQVFIFALQGSK